ncbi:ATP-binding protein [Streptomyces sp. NPDC051907]|uniref:ATP-binding protein n=1 Tax=Streptomyces sp. NPDC051907 TaxID=3155284 RepID=UPI00343CDF93
MPTTPGPWGGTSGLAQCAMAATPEAARTVRHFARAVAQRWRLNDDHHEALSVIVTELVSNVVLHSGSPWVAVAIKVRGNTLIAEVRDGGVWKHRPARRKEPLDAHADCGHGLRLVDAFATTTSTRRLEAGSVVAAEIVMPAYFQGVVGPASPTGPPAVAAQRVGE